MDDEVQPISFSQLVHQDVERLCREASIEDAKFKVEQFTQFVIDILTTADQLDDGTICNYGKTDGKAGTNTIRVNGYDFNEIEDTLDIFICSDYSGKEPPTNFSRPQIDELFAKGQRFFEAALVDLYEKIDEANEAHNLAREIHSRYKKHQLSRVRFMLFLDGVSKTKEKDSERVKDFDFLYRIYDLNSLERYAESTKERPPIEIDFRSFGETVPCLPIVSCGDDFDACVAMISGDLLCKLYAEHGSRLLERNIRSFLQSKNKINSKIKETIQKTPERFLAYNNGISCTAEHVDFEFKGEGCKIIRIKNFQIVNGGQTTASIYNAFKKHKADLSKVQVQAKISIIKNPELVDETVKKISLYANSQNKVSQSDFDALEPFHAKIEQFSRTVWAPSSPRHMHMSKWYYERARGAYGDEKSRSRRSAFVSTYPENQVFTKTDLAKYESVWDELPQRACLGEQKNFRDFTNRTSNADPKIEVDRQFFMDAVAKRLLYEAVLDVVKRVKLPAYRAQTANYALAYVLHNERQNLDLKEIWRLQAVPPLMVAALEACVPVIHKRLSDSFGGQNVTEWCKKDICWETISSLKIKTPSISAAKGRDMESKES